MRFLVFLGILLTLAQPGMAWAKSKAKAQAAHPATKTAPHKLTAPPKAASKSAEALILADQEKWAEARKAAESSGDLLTQKLVRWLDYARPNSGASFKEITELLNGAPDWPQRNLLERRAEEAISQATPQDLILDWFQAHPPISADGGTAFGAALLVAGKTEEAHAVLRKTWVNEDFGILQERQFLSKYRDILTTNDHGARINRLMWEGQTSSAERMMLFANAPTRHLAHARLMLMKQKGTPSQALESVPEDLRNDPGLLFDSLRWYRRKD
ncbi:MAG: hypothetical protein HQL43_10835, partial [Alphaproteobacteria bacterium]|nr:hypothetical protein [Alphaproteobacteria bacterium]